MFSGYSKIHLYLFLGCLCILFLFGFFIFLPIYLSPSIIIPFSNTPFDICSEYPNFWNIFKQFFIVLYIFSSIIYSKLLVSFLSTFFNLPPSATSKEKNISRSSLNLLIGFNATTNTKIYLSEKSLYQNILITGTIGTGKTSSAIYPFSKQLIQYQSNEETQKLGILCLDVKGNLYQQIIEYATNSNRLQDLIVIGFNSAETYNPLHKPNIKPSVLANRLKTILTLFSPNNTESYWLDKVEQVLTECIKYCRLYNNGYVTFQEIHNLTTLPDYFYQKLTIIKNSFQQNKLSESDMYDLITSLNFFEKELINLDDRTSSILKSEVTRITNLFISDYEILRLFSPSKSQITFNGFDSVLKKGKIVVLSMNVAQYKNLSKTIAAYLKLDFQSEVLMRLREQNLSFERPVCFICDEFHEFCTVSDSDFFAQSREAKCINIVATQSYTSLFNSLHDEHAVKVITQNLINKLWFRSDDIYTIESAQKQIGKEDKERHSTSVSESAAHTNYNYILESFNSTDSNLSESINTYVQNDFIFDLNSFSQDLETFTCICFLSDGSQILKPCKLKMFPHFK